MDTGKHKHLQDNPSVTKQKIIQVSMTSWKTILIYSNFEIADIPLKCGIIQGDLSFTIALMLSPESSQSRHSENRIRV